MRIIFFILLWGSLSDATLSPRMQSAMTQISGSVTETRNHLGQHKMNNKFGIDLLYLVREGPTFGIRYLNEIRNESGFEKSQSYGFAIGYYAYSGLHALAYYDFQATTRLWSSGHGYQLSLGYLEHLGYHLHAGFQLSAKTTKYTTSTELSLVDSRIVNDQFMSLVMMYLF